MVENGLLFAQRVHSARTAHGTPPLETAFAKTVELSVCNPREGMVWQLTAWLLIKPIIMGFFWEDCGDIGLQHTNEECEDEKTSLGYISLTCARSSSSFRVVP